MRRIAGYGTLVVLVNFVLTVWHLYVLGKLHPAMTGPQLALIGSAINLIPLIGAVLLILVEALGCWTGVRVASLDPKAS
jgi:hypothetical protein